MCATETSCFATLQTSFHLLSTGPGLLAVDGRQLAHGLPARLIPLNELAVLLLHPSTVLEQFRAALGQPQTDVAEFAASVLQAARCDRPGQHAHHPPQGLGKVPECRVSSACDVKKRQQPLVERERGPRRRCCGDRERQDSLGSQTLRPIGRCHSRFRPVSVTTCAA